MADVPVLLHFKSGATHRMNYTSDYPILGLDPEGRVIVDMASEAMGTFGLTLCCDAFDKGYETGVYCRACGGAKGDDIGWADPDVADPWVRSEPAPELSDRKFYRSVVQIEVLSEDPYPIHDTDLDGVVYDITEGHCNGYVEVVVSNDVMDGLETAQRLMKSGSTPDFFRLTEGGVDDDS